MRDQAPKDDQPDGSNNPSEETGKDSKNQILNDSSDHPDCIMVTVNSTKAELGFQNFVKYS